MGITTISLYNPEGQDPMVERTLAADGANFSIRRKVSALAKLLVATISGKRLQNSVLRFGEKTAWSTLACSGVAGSGTAVINGTTLTDAQHNATQTGTVQTGGCSADDTIVINGVTFTAKVSPSGQYEFATSANTTTQATNIKNAINAAIDPLIKGVVSATSASAVVTFRAVTPGTAGNAITTVQGVGASVTMGGATMAGGAAAVNNEFDFTGSDIETATALANAINDSTTQGANPIKNIVRASNYAATIQCGTLTEGSRLLIHGSILRAVASVTGYAEMGTFAISGNDTADATALAAAINNHPLLRSKVVASSSTDTVTVRALAMPPTDLAIQQLAGTGATISGNLAPVATVCVSSLWKGTIGNCITLSGTNGVTAGAARLANGTLGTVVTL